MSAKRRKLETRTIIYILIILIIIMAVVYVVTLPPDDSEPVLSVQTVLANADSGIYDNKIIIVEGIYDESAGGPALTPPTNDANPNPTQFLYLDLTGIDLENNTMIERDKYQVTGELQTVTITGRRELVATNVDPV
jgi:hypothetical protein